MLGSSSTAQRHLVMPYNFLDFYLASILFNPSICSPLLPALHRNLNPQICSVDVSF